MQREVQCLNPVRVFLCFSETTTQEALNLFIQSCYCGTRPSPGPVTNCGGSSGISATCWSEADPVIPEPRDHGDETWLQARVSQWVSTGGDRGRRSSRQGAALLKREGNARQSPRSSTAGSSSQHSPQEHIILDQSHKHHVCTEGAGVGHQEELV